jgi:hypothetical protein
MWITGQVRNLGPDSIDFESRTHRFENSHGQMVALWRQIFDSHEIEPIFVKNSANDDSPSLSKSELDVPTSGSFSIPAFATRKFRFSVSMDDSMLSMLKTNRFWIIYCISSSGKSI